MRQTLQRLRPLLDRLFGLDLRSLAALRIALSGYLLWDLADRARALEAHYTDLGVYPVSMQRFAHQNDHWPWDEWGIHWPNYWSLHALRGDLNWEIFLFGLNALFVLGMLAGYKTRLTTFLSWFFLVSLHNRNEMILHGGDEMARVLLFWGMFLPLGARWSLDGSAALRRAYGESVPDRVVSSAGFGLLWQVCLIYFFTAYLKKSPEWHAQGTALYYALSLDQFGTWPGRLLRQSLFLTKLGTWGSIGWEALGPLLLFVPKDKVRTFVVLGFWAFHLLGIGIFMDVWPLPTISAILWIGLLPGSFWDGLATRWQRARETPLKLGLAGGYARLVALRNRRVKSLVARRFPLPEVRPSALGTSLAALFIVFVTCWNLESALPRIVHGPYGAIRWLAPFTRLDQNWGMFAPYPSHDDGWYAVPAVTKDGRTFDAFTRRAVAWEKPAEPRLLFPNERWRKYLTNLWLPKFRPQWRGYAEWACRSSKKYDGARNRIESLQVYYMLERTPPPGQTPKVEKVEVFGKYWCNPDDAPEEIKKQYGIASRNP